MTKEEALIFFSFDESEDDLEEVYEDYLFEFQQFFQSKVPIEKVFNAKLQKLKKMHEAYLFFGGVKTQTNFSCIKWDFAGYILDVYNQYHSYRGELKTKIASVKNAVELGLIIEAYLDLEKKYSLEWPIVELDEGEVISIGVEPDPMKMYNCLKELQTENILSFDDFTKLKNEKNENYSVNFLLKEMKRLSLLRKNN